MDHGILDNGARTDPGEDAMSAGQLLDRATQALAGGQFDAAEAACRHGLEIADDPAELHHVLGLAYHGQGKLDLARLSIEQAIAHGGGTAGQFNNLGNLLQLTDRFDDAVISYRRALELDPRFTDAHYNLGKVAEELDRLEDAAAHYRDAVDCCPEYFDAHYNLGRCLKSLSRLEEAVDAYQRAVALQPASAKALNNLGNVLQDLERVDEAVDCYRRSLAVDPVYADALSNLGGALRMQYALDEAADCFRQAIAADPNHWQAHSNLAGVWKEQGDLDRAIEGYRRAMAIDPGFSKGHTNLIFAMDSNPAYDVAELQEERRRWDSAHARLLDPGDIIFENDRDPVRVLRVGYVSPDFRRHSAAYSFGPVVFGHDPAAVEVFCYSDVKKPDDMTDRFRAAAAIWRDVRGLSDEALAEQVRSDRIDILVDLPGHTADHRLLVFARRPAPIQVSGWGSATGTGLAAMDYLMSDAVVVPDDEAPLYAESIVHLPCYMAFLPPDNAPPVSDTPAGSAGFVRFGCFNRLEKVTDQCLEVWARILRRVPGSRLVMKTKQLDDAGTRDRLHRTLAKFGVAEDRLELLGGSPREAHLASHSEIDLVLDPFPHGGGISSLEALWMGVPVVALHGRTVTGRVGASILRTIGMPGFIATDMDGYVDIASEAVGDLERLTAIRHGLRGRLAKSPIVDNRLYMHAVEHEYRRMWRTWCSAADERLRGVA